MSRCKDIESAILINTSEQIPTRAVRDTSDILKDWSWCSTGLGQDQYHGAVLVVPILMTLKLKSQSEQDKQGTRRNTGLQGIGNCNALSTHRLVSSSPELAAAGKICA
jgi:hypothetical protein